MVIHSKDVWGEKYWYVIHLSAATYPNCPAPEEKKQSRDFYRSLIHMLPCKLCAEHYALMYRESFNNNSRYDLFAWTVSIHNQVNQRLGKPTMSLKEAMDYYNVPLEQCDEKPFKLPASSVIYLIVFIILISLLFVLCAKYFFNKNKQVV